MDNALLLKLLALLSAYALAAATAPAADCNRKCGNVDISYPFGMTKDCFKDPDFQIICNTSSSGQPIPYLARGKNDTVQVLNISENNSEILVSMPVCDICYNPSEGYNMGRNGFWVPSKFVISKTKNKFNVVGCDTYAFLYDQKEKNLNGCDSCCDNPSSVTHNNVFHCSGAGCSSCPSDLEEAVMNYTITIVFYRSQQNVPGDLPRCSFAFVGQIGSFTFPLDHHDDDLKKQRESNRSMVILDRAVDKNRSCGGACKSKNAECKESESVGGHYYCKCKLGFEGNPDTADGCKDGNECLNGALNNCTHHCHNLEGGYMCVLVHVAKRAMASMKLDQAQAAALRTKIQTKLH